MTVSINFEFCLSILVLYSCITIGTADPPWSRAAYAQADDENNTRASYLESVTTQNRTTFSAIGQVSSLVTTVPDSGFNITNAFKVILAGEWNLSVNKGNVTNFAVSFLASPMDGSKPHIHQITNFSVRHNEEPVRLTQDKSVSINGTADIKINGVVIWDDADLSISVSKGNTFNIDPDDHDTGNHFGGQQIYGIVTRIFE